MFGDDGGPAGTSWRGVNLALILLALVLAVGSVVLFRQGASATPGRSEAEALSEQYDAVTAAARKETLAFLTVDYRDMDPLIAKVLSGATGDFEKQYDRDKATLKAKVQDQRASWTSEVLQVGIGDVDDTTAVVFVAADSQVTKKGTKGKAQERNYRLRLDMVLEGGRWLVSQLRFVG